jgi:tetratricopeptide (TPR) repeat protein
MLTMARAADCQRALGRLSEALATYDTLAKSHNNRGNAFLLQGKPDVASGHYDQAIEIYARLVEQQGRNELAMSHNNHGVARRAQAKMDAAIGDFENAIKILTRLIEQKERGKLALSHNDRGVARRSEVKLGIAFGYSEKAIDVLTRTRLMEQVGRNEPAVALAVSFKNRGYARLVQGKADAAVGDFRKTMEIYARLVEQEGQRDLALQFAKSLSPMAWIFATYPDKSFRDGSKAKEYALKACELTEWRAFVPVETLAAAYAETGNFGEAVKWQENALKLAPPKLKIELRSRLELYKSGNPYRTPLPKAD